MRVRSLLPTLFLCAFVLARGAAAQDPGLLHALPPDTTLAIMRDVVFAQHGDTTLRFDLYRSVSITERAPLLIIYNGFAVDGLKTQPQQVGWSKLGAASGFAVIGYDSHARGDVTDFDDLVTYLRTHADALNIDATTVAFLAWSGHVSRGLSLIMDPARQAIRAAVLLYGVGDVGALRMDLPTLFVRAGLDNTRLNKPLDAVLARGLAENAPITIINYGSGTHGFELNDDSDVSRTVVDQVLSFLKTNVRPTIRESLVAKTDVARAAAALYAGNWSVAIAGYEALTRADPENMDAELRLGQSLLGNKEYAGALEHLQRAWELDGGHHAIDIGYPAAVAAAGIGKFEAAEPWLRILQSRGFTADRLRSDPGFKRIVSDARFESLFQNAN